ncbi:MGMT family protein [Rhodococcus aerolatus]
MPRKPHRPAPAAVPHPKARPWPAGHVPTPFQRAVIDVVAALPPGDLVTFGEVGELAGREMGGQAVANVLRGMPDLPWWRVLPAGGRLYGDLAAVQAPLLRAEGHGVDEHRRVHPRPE